MINIMCRNELLKVFISNELMSLKKTKCLIGKGLRMIRQNKVNAVVIEYDHSSVLSKLSLEFFYRLRCKSGSLKIAIVHP
jgi:hypothetical protein